MTRLIFKPYKIQLWHTRRIVFSVGIDLSLPMGMRLNSGRVKFMGTCWDWKEAVFPDSRRFVEGRIFWFAGLAFSFGVIKKFPKKSIPSVTSNQSNRERK